MVGAKREAREREARAGRARRARGLSRPSRELCAGRSRAGGRRSRPQRARSRRRSSTKRSKLPPGARPRALRLPRGSRLHVGSKRPKPALSACRALVVRCCLLSAPQLRSAATACAAKRDLQSTVRVPVLALQSTHGSHQRPRPRAAQRRGVRHQGERIGVGAPLHAGPWVAPRAVARASRNCGQGVVRGHKGPARRCDRKGSAALRPQGATRSCADAAELEISPERPLLARSSGAKLAGTGAVLRRARPLRSGSEGRAPISASRPGPQRRLAERPPLRSRSARLGSEREGARPRPHSQR